MNAGEEQAGDDCVETAYASAAEVMKTLLPHGVNGSLRGTDESIGDDYDAILHALGSRACMWTMALEAFFGVGRDWILPHLHESAAGRCFGTSDMRMCYRRSASYIAESGASRIRVRGLVSLILDIAAESGYATNAEGFYGVLSVYGWDGIIAARRDFTKFPYREYGLTHMELTRMLAEGRDADGAEWVLGLLGWIMDERPVIEKRIDRDWMRGLMDYPLDFVRESSFLWGRVTREAFDRDLHSVTDWMKSEGARRGMSNHTFADSIDGMLESQRDVDERERMVDSTNIVRWKKVIDSLRLMDGSMFDSLARNPIAPDSVSGFNLYTYFTSRERWLGNTNSSMKQSRALTLEYAEHATADIQSMRRWVAWIHVQALLYDDSVNIAFRKTKDSRRDPVLAAIFSNPVMLRRVPSAVIDWLDRGIVPRMVDYGPATLDVSGYVSELTSDIAITGHTA